MDDYRVDTTSLSVLAKEKVLQYITNTDLGQARKLPREEELARLIGVSRVTLRTALNELAIEGIITRQQGRGTFVNAAASEMNVSLTPVTEFNDLIQASGYTPRVQILGTTVIPQGRSRAVRLGLEAHDPIVVTKKVFYADERFCALCIDDFPLELIGSEDELRRINEHTDSVFRYLANTTGRRIVRDHITLAAVPDAEARTWADGAAVVPSKPLLRIEGLNYDAEDRPLLVAREYVDTDVIAFSLIRQRRIHYA